MFLEPKKYNANDHFFFEADKDLEKICIAPKDKTDALDIYWYVTNDKDGQKNEQVDMLKDYVDQTGKLPKWNK